MNEKSSISTGMWAVAAVFGLIGGGVAYAIYAFGFFASLLIAILVAIIVLLILWLGWRDQDSSSDDSGAGAIAEQSASRAASATTAAMATDADAAGATAAETSPAAKADARSEAPIAATAAPEIKPSTTLPGQDDLSSRKGTWKYDGDAEAAPEKPAAKKPAAKKPAAVQTDMVDYDGDGVVEGKDEGKRPAALDGPRDGKADNLKEIKGIGPKMEKMCNSLGFYHFDQIAKWTSDEVAWVDANLEGFKGRVTRDTWVAQAKILADGGDTEFSKKVDKGGVYK